MGLRPGDSLGEGEFDLTAQILAWRRSRWRGRLNVHGVTSSFLRAMDRSWRVRRAKAVAQRAAALRPGHPVAEPRIAQQRGRKVGRGAKACHARYIADCAPRQRKHLVDHFAALDLAFFRHQREAMDRIEAKQSRDQEIKVPVREPERESPVSIRARPAQQQLELAAAEKIGEQAAQDRRDAGGERRRGESFNAILVELSVTPATEAPIRAWSTASHTMIDVRSVNCEAPIMATMHRM
jgi:hypothetical protein